jgi:hypothetical protein
MQTPMASCSMRNSENEGERGAASPRPPSARHYRTEAITHLYGPRLHKPIALRCQHFGARVLTARARTGKKGHGLPCRSCPSVGPGRRRNSVFRARHRSRRRHHRRSLAKVRPKNLSQTTALRITRTMRTGARSFDLSITRRGANLATTVGRVRRSTLAIPAYELRLGHDR